jgi:hypothetical protein
MRIQNGQDLGLTNQRSPNSPRNAVIYMSVKKQPKPDFLATDIAEFVVS